MRFAFAAVILLAANLARADENPNLDKAKRSFAALDYAETDAALERAWKDPGNTRNQLLEILKLQGTVAASLGQSPRAVTLFLRLLTLDPEAKLAEGLPPRVMTPFFEAKGRLSEKAALKVKTGASRDPDGKARLTLDVESDALGLVKKARFHVRIGDGDRQVVVVDGLPANMLVEGHPVEWWAEALNEFDGALAVLGSDAVPLVGPDGAVASPPLVAAPPTPPPEVKAASTPMSPVRAVSFVVAGAGVGAGVVGFILGGQAANLKTRLDTLPTDSNGHVVGMGQKEAFDLDAQQRGLATGANILWAGAGALVVTGVVLFIAGAPPVTPTVSLGPNGASVGVAGTF